MTPFMTLPSVTRRAILVLLLVTLACGALVSVAGAAGPAGGESTAPVLAAAGFTLDRTGGTAPLTVNFTDTSDGSPAAWLWDFGDGDLSGEKNPTHTYRQIGNYTVTLTVRNSAGSSQYTRPMPITVSTRVIVPEPDFTFNTSEGVAPLAVRFADTSYGAPVAWSWDFDADGTADSTMKDPVCVYNRPGNYTVILRVMNAFGTRSFTRTDVIHVGNPGPVVMIAANRTAGLPPLAVQFSDNSTAQDITERAWDFDNDGTVDSTEKDPVCVYNRPGNYTVSLRTTNASGSTTIVREDLVTVASPAPAAWFVANITFGGRPLAVRFTDNSTGAGITGRAWDFDSDGTVDSTEKDPVCVYNLPGDYTVRLTVTNAFGSNTTVRAGVVTVTNGVVPDFSANVTSGTSPLAVQFTDASSGPGINGWAWDFDYDNVTDSREQNPVCVYRKPGNYTVSLRVMNAFGTEGVAGIDLITVTSSLTPDFTANQTSGIAPLAVRFTDTSTGPGITGWAWDFNNDGIVDSTVQNPDCVYRRAGNYTVGLAVTSPNGTVTGSKLRYVSVTSGEPRARFSVNRTSGPAPLAIQFRDTTLGPNITGRAWDFNNDGIVDSTEQNPVCVYNLPGDYTVRLTSTNAYGGNSTVKNGFVTVDREG